MPEKIEDFCVKRLMAKTNIAPSICEATFFRVLQKASLKWTHVQRKGILTKIDLKLKSLLEKFLVNMQCAIVKSENIRKPMVLEKVEVNSLKFSYY